MSRFKLLSQGPLAEWVGVGRTNKLFLSSSTRHFWVGCIMLLDVSWWWNLTSATKSTFRNTTLEWVFSIWSHLSSIYSPPEKLTCHLMKRDHWTISAIFQPSIFRVPSWVYFYIFCFEFKHVPGDSSRDLFVAYLEVTNTPLISRHGSLNHPFKRSQTRRIARYGVFIPTFKPVINRVKCELPPLVS